MKNALITLIVIASFSSINADSNQNERCESLKEFYKLWSDSSFGKDPAHETSAWIIQNSKGDLEWIRWPSSRKWKGEIWRGSIPPNVIAQVHTHPLNTDPRPSYKDLVFSHNVNKPLYTISREAIWKVIPNGTISEVAKTNWHQSNNLVCAELVQLATDNVVLPLAFPMQHTKPPDFAWYRLHQDD
jgi:hypothetical protein